MLDPAHAELLRASAISDEVVEARGYYSAISTKAELGRLGFGPAQRRIPSLVIPVWDVDGACVGHQLRPDEPRELKSKPVKYETARDARQVLDVNPLAQPKLDDPSIPIVVTEGVRKADSAVSRGMLAIGLNGVWGWVGRNERGGKAALIDWRSNPLNGRLILLAFDNDVLTKGQVHQALTELSAFLGRRKATVRIVMLPDDPSGAKVGLDDWLAANPDAGFAELAGLAIDELPDVEPASDTFDDVEDERGWVVLDDVRALLVKYVWFPSDGLADAVALWVHHTYVLDVFVFTPRLHVRSPMKRSGKSRLLEIVQLLVPKPSMTTITTAAGIYRLIELERPTILIDEIDRVFGDDVINDPSGLIAALNAGFQPGVPVLRMVGQGADMTPKYFPTYAAVAMAGIGTIPDTIADRSITIRLERRPPSATVARLRPREAKPVAAELSRRLAAWSSRHAEALEAARPSFPRGMNDRAENMWEPLFAIADEAGGTWPKRARDVAVELSGRHDREDMDFNLELRLLADVHDTWPEHIDRRFSAEIVKALNMIDGAPWADRGKGIGFTTNQLARKLKTFNVQPEKIRIGSETKQGYYLTNVMPALVRYGIVGEQQPTPTDPVETEHPEQTEQAWSQEGSTTRDVPDVPDVPVVEGASGDVVDASPNGDAPSTSGLQKIPRKARR